MTIPGSADFQDITLWRGLPLVSGNPVVIPNAGQTFGPAPAGNFAGVHVNISNQTLPVTVLVNFYADAAATFNIEAVQFTLTAASILNVIVPAAGDFYSVTVTPIGAGSVSLSLYAAPTNIGAGKLACLMPSPELLVDLTVQNAGVDSHTQLPAFCGGPAWVYVGPADATGMLSFQVSQLFGSGNVSHRVHDFGAPAGVATASLVLPWAPIALRVINNDGVNPHSYRAAVVPLVSP